MDTLKAEPIELQGLKELKEMLVSEGPCISAYLPLNSESPGQNTRIDALEWKELFRGIETNVDQYGAKGRELLRSIADWKAFAPEGGPRGRSLAVFRSPNYFAWTWLGESVPPRAVAGPRFYIRPLLPDLTRGREFYILALSQKDVRMLRCNSRTSEEIAFAPGVITSFDAWMNTSKPDHTTDSMATGGPSTGHMKGVIFTTSSDREDKGEYLAHFFRQIDRGVNETLRGKTAPLILAGVDYELALYRIVNTHPNLAEECVRGAPNGLKAGGMHARALEAILRASEKKIEALLAEYNHKAGGGASNRLKDIVKAAHDGRVLTLLVSDSLELTGSFDETTYSVKGRESGTSNDEDLINDAAVQTILHAGQVYVVPNGKMPNGAPLSAIYRFALASAPGS
ncbi:MAG: hypothetical protein JO033_05855 [Acidobacteriaceae bacterium]|nr:hypothetical protein [Acidobacteriaceae bacterium]MBV9502967.1 hypothetical protein [Acidobacteriaceae bacterium]